MSPQDTQQGFIRTYFSNPRSIVTLVVVCMLIAFVIGLINELPFYVNLLFSFSFGFSISMLETFFRTRRKPMSDKRINIISLLIGSVFGTSVIYGYLVYHGILAFGETSTLLLVNFAWGGLFSSLAFYFFWVHYRNQALTLALREQQLKTAETENLHQRAEFRLLQSQMEPHFLFNTLANIQSLIDIDSGAAKTMVADLSKMLRVTLQNTRQDRCTVAQELELVRAYLGIQQVRLGDRLRVNENVDVNLHAALMPPMLLQPIIENSLKHGVEVSTGASDILLQISTVTMEPDAPMLMIVIDDNCQPKQTPKSGHGLSLTNIQQRLQHLFGNQASFTSVAKPQGWHTKITLPLHWKDESL